MTDRQMIKRGREFAKFLPDFILLGVNPGYLFVRREGHGSSLDLPSDVVDHLYKQLCGRADDQEP